MNYQVPRVGEIHLGYTDSVNVWFCHILQVHNMFISRFEMNHTEQWGFHSSLPLFLVKQSIHIHCFISAAQCKKICSVESTPEITLGCSLHSTLCISSQALHSSVCLTCIILFSSSSRCFCFVYGHDSYLRARTAIYIVIYIVICVVIFLNTAIYRT